MNLAILRKKHIIFVMFLVKYLSIPNKKIEWKLLSYNCEFSDWLTWYGITKGFRSWEGNILLVSKGFRSWEGDISIFSNICSINTESLADSINIVSKDTFFKGIWDRKEFYITSFSTCSTYVKFASLACICSAYIMNETAELTEVSLKLLLLEEGFVLGID